ncbi:MAG: hypothetical protein QF578_06670 [Alphaproteobacteria bacterium]|nr:hypothetical protein [Alphaproteobacteria bacterium]MDP6564493.1 hypothetical protein [Alphaproteobacteria bacterium]
MPVVSGAMIVVGTVPATRCGDTTGSSGTVFPGMMLQHLPPRSGAKERDLAPMIVIWHLIGIGEIGAVDRL